MLFVDFHDVSCQYLLKHLPLIFVGREAKRGHDHITFAEPARSQIAQHGAHIFILELRAAQFSQHNVALLNLAVLALCRLYAEAIALTYHS